MTRTIDRRQLLRGATLASGGLALSAYMPAWAQTISGGIVKPMPTVSGDDISLHVAHQMMTIDGRESHAIGINGTAPAPLIRLREGQTARLTLTNGLSDEQTSIHWHGLILPFQMDGVPGISFPGVDPGKSFTYEFPVKQAGTYWYHSHSGLQEQLGHYGPLVIDPAGEDPIASDREHVIMLSDHSPLHPHAIFRKLKLQGGYFNFQKQTLGGLLRGDGQSAKERREWGKMRMDPSDVADVTGSTYTYLVNGHGPKDNWTGLFRPGERVRLRVINASAMTTFNVRIPGLKMTVVACDGLNVRPVTFDEFQIGVAETYDVIVTPTDDRAYTLVGESVDRSGMARATLAPREGMAAAVPPLRKRPLASMKDMGMGGMDMSGGSMAGMDHAAMGHSAAEAAPAVNDPACPPEHAAMGHCTPGATTPMPTDMAGMDHGAGDMNHSMRDFSNAPGVKKTPTVQTISPMPMDRMGEPGQGLENVGHKVLVYRDLMAVERNPDVRAPDRAMRIHLTGNMERYMWAFDGEKLSEVKDPIPFLEGERVRVTLVNDTMMGHPIHLHGHYFELVTGHGEFAPRKHTVMVQPGGTATFDLTADAVGDWAFHCHMLYHMHAGMMQVVTVRPRGETRDEGVFLLVAAAPLALATPVAAQDHSGHTMPGMTMPAKPAAEPQAKPAARPAVRAKPKPRPAAPKKASPAPAAADPHAGHDMSGMAMPKAPAQADPHAGHIMPHAPAPATPAPATPADPHAGHDMSGMAGGMSQNMGMGGTALPPGNAPAPAAPEPNYADRVYSPQEMADARALLRGEHGGGTFWQVNFNLAEVQIRDGRDSFRWDGEAWFGGDINRLTVKTEGKGEFGRSVEDAEVQALYSRAVGPYFNLQAGIRYDFKPSPSRTYATVGFEGLAPYWFDVEGALFLSDKGDVLGRLEGYYDQRITQRLVLQPRAELNFAAQDVPENGIGSGLSDIELGLRLRYEIKREFAPYIGVSYDRKLGGSARFARAEGEGVGGPSVVVGVRTWF